MSNTVGKILESAGHLKMLLAKGKSVSRREVCDLRDAFDKLHEHMEPYEYSKKATQCDNLLKQLTEQVMGDANAATGDMEGHDKKENWKFMNIPGRRRLQTLIVSLFLFFTGVPFFLILTALLIFNWFTFPLMVVYGAYMLLSRPKHPLRKQSWYVNGGFWKHYSDYFPIRLVVPKSVRQKFSDKKNYVFAYHPHGVHTFGAMVNFGADANGLSQMLPGIKVHVQTLSLNFWIPFWREFFFFGGCGDASAGCIRKTLRAGPGESVLLVVGGAEESLMSMPGTNELTLTKRKGFVKLALEAGAPLVPVYAFGETNVYDNLAAGKPKLQKFLLSMQKKLGFALPLIHGRGYFNYHFGILPHRRPIVVVVGAPLELPKLSQPSSEDVEKWHRKYVETLTALYLENKDAYDLNSTGLKIVR
jgi:2-acylglycerol O-acyltransferase 2